MTSAVGSIPTVSTRLIVILRLGSTFDVSRGEYCRAVTTKFRFLRSLPIALRGIEPGTAFARSISFAWLGFIATRYIAGIAPPPHDHTSRPSVFFCSSLGMGSGRGGGVIRHPATLSGNRRSHLIRCPYQSRLSKVSAKTTTQSKRGFTTRVQSAHSLWFHSRTVIRTQQF